MVGCLAAGSIGAWRIVLRRAGEVIGAGTIETHAGIIIVIIVVITDIVLGYKYTVGTY